MKPNGTQIKPDTGQGQKTDACRRQQADMQEVSVSGTHGSSGGKQRGPSDAAEKAPDVVRRVWPRAETLSFLSWLDAPGPIQGTKSCTQGGRKCNR